MTREIAKTPNRAPHRATDKAALKRKYKENRPPMGVYRIRAAGDAAAYLGAATDVRARLNRHRFALRMGNHPCAALQRAWREGGEAALDFEILDTLEHDENAVADPAADPAEELTLLLAMWRDKLAAAGEAVVPL